jgi:hypothetical protein
MSVTGRLASWLHLNRYPAILREREHCPIKLDRGRPVAAPVQPQGGVEHAEVGGRRREVQALAQPQAEVAATHQAVMEQRQRAVLQRRRKIDQHIAA